ncbi:hypothetical protein JAAARDRAFT_584109 [Jaapia argillacea MUCL 33604]|uniref:Uncharacterized protein n=1 Tax=Jaapia argillacea MUCL 33604 TaxID=933084 RepID=A0A067P688_9AGAM|nr:hypothetical protein JAAARDRAFT_584109 [Jaapia argillacea MUCL 33604]
MNTISLVDALVVNMLTSCIFMDPVEGYVAVDIAPLTSQLRIRVFGSFKHCVQFITTCAFTLVVWSRLKTFGTTEQCNLNNVVKFPIFGISVKVAKAIWLRDIIFTAISLALFGFVWGGLSMVKANNILVKRLPILREGLDDDEDDDASERVLNPFEKAYLFRILLHVLPQLGIHIYTIVSIEQTLHRNNVFNQAEQWTFGQTLSMLLLLQPLLDMWSAFPNSLLWRGFTVGWDE